VKVNYSKVLSRAWEITWRWKVLWILGFLASLGRGTGSTGNTSYSMDSNNWQWGQRFRVPPEVIGLLVAAGCLAILIAIAIWVISIMARGGLIAGVQQVEEEGSTTFLQAWRVGRDRFWTLFGISILAFIPAFLLILIGVGVLVLLILGTVGAFDQAAEVAGALGIAGSVLCGGTLCCGAVIVAAVLDQIRVYAERAAILEGLGWTEAFGRGWQVLKENLGPTIVFWIIFLVIGIVIGAVVAAGVAVIALPFLGAMSQTDPGAWIVAPICFGGIVGAIVFALIGSIIETFTSTTWTLAYREFTGMAMTVPEEAEIVA
jgi:hypothetical protein